MCIYNFSTLQMDANGKFATNLQWDTKALAANRCKVYPLEPGKQQGTIQTWCCSQRQKSWQKSCCFGSIEVTTWRHIIHDSHSLLKASLALAYALGLYWPLTSTGSDSQHRNVSCNRNPASKAHLARTRALSKEKPLQRCYMLNVLKFEQFHRNSILNWNDIRRRQQ